MDLQQKAESIVEKARLLLGSQEVFSGLEFFSIAEKKLILRCQENESVTDEIQTREILGARFHSKNQLVCGSTTRVNAEGIKDLLQSLLKKIDCGEGREFLATIPPLQSTKTRGKKIYADPVVMSIEHEEKQRRLLNLSKRVLTLDSVVSCETSYTENLRAECLWTKSSLRPLTQDFANFKIDASAKILLFGETFHHWERDQETRFYRIDWSRLSTNIAKRIQSIQKIDSVPSGNYPCVLSSRSACLLVDHVYPHLAGDYILKDHSLLKDKMGEKVFSPLLTLYDHPRQSKTLGFNFWDHEGSPTARLDLVRGGILTAFANNHETAHLLDSQSTANAHRNLKTGEHRVFYHNLCVEPGRSDSIDLLRGLKTGIFVQEIHNIQSQGEDLFFDATIDFISHGQTEFTGFEVACKANLFQIFSNLVAVGRDLKWYDHIASPSLLTTGIEVIDGQENT